MEEKQVKLEELMKDEAFVDAIFSSETSEEVQKLFAEKGVELTMEEAEEFGTAIHKAMAEQNVELSEDALDSVAGGGLMEDMLFWYQVGLRLANYLAKKCKRKIC